MPPHRNHVEARSTRAPARQYVAESHDHKPDAPSRAESRSAAKHTAGTAAGARTGRPGGIFKQDRAARLAWGENVYAELPKSVFALAAWHLANVASGEADNAGAAEQRMIDELIALRDGGHLPKAQADRAIKSIRAALAKTGAA